MVKANPTTKILFTDETPKAHWIVEQLIPRGHLSTIFAPAGVGKTRMVAALAVQMTRPEGLFMGRQVSQGRTLIIDADDPSAFGYRVWLNRFIAGHYDTNRDLLEIRGLSRGLDLEGIEALQNELLDDPPSLIIIDTFASAFLGLDSIKGHHVQLALIAFAKMAEELNCAIITLDHVGKLRPGETVASRGPYGSAKTFAPRAIFALSRIPPADVEGRDVIRVECTKMSYAVMPDTVGVEITLEQADTIAHLRLTDLPEGNKLEASITAMRTALRAEPGVPVPRKALLSTAVETANITERYAETALAELLKREDKRIEITSLRLRGSPQVFTWIIDPGFTAGMEN